MMCVVGAYTHLGGHSTLVDKTSRVRTNRLVPQSFITDSINIKPFFAPSFTLPSVSEGGIAASVPGWGHFQGPFDHLVCRFIDIDGILMGISLHFPLVGQILAGTTGRLIQLNKQHFQTDSHSLSNRLLEVKEELFLGTEEYPEPTISPDQIHLIKINTNIYSISFQYKGMGSSMLI